MKGKCIKHILGMALAAFLLMLGISPPGQALRTQMAETERVCREAPAGGSDSEAAEAFEEAESAFRLTEFFPAGRESGTDDAEHPAADRILVPGGHSVGVALLTEGVIVVGASDLGTTPSPARIAGLKAGDRIISVNGTALESAAQLSLLMAPGAPCAFEIERDGNRFSMEIEPAADPRDGVCRLGAWVRDSTAGIGTLSFYDPASGTFGALGHAIADVDTGVMLPVGSGGIYESDVVDVNRGSSGEPGELLGEFFEAETQLGEIAINTSCGIFGTADEPIENPLYPEGLPAAARNEVHTGTAQLLTTLTEGEITAYACEITKINDRSGRDERSMVIEITDEDLLAETGGIVQGMSGSPIIQDGKLVGAVTHVLVNSPDTGYGIFIENMLEAAS